MNIRYRHWELMKTMTTVSLVILGMFLAGVGGWHSALGVVLILTSYNIEKRT